MLKIDKCDYDSHNNVVELITCGASIKTSLENTIILNQNKMDDESYKEMKTQIASALVSEDGTITKYDPYNKHSIRTKKLRP